MNKEIYQICSSLYKNNMLSEYFNNAILELSKYTTKEEAVDILNSFYNLINGELYLVDIEANLLKDLLYGIYNEYGMFYLKSALVSLNKYIEKNNRLDLKDIYDEFNLKVVDLFTSLQTNRLILRKVQVEDTKILWDNFYNNYDEYRYFRSYRLGYYKELEAMVETQLKSYNEGNYFRWAITLKDNTLIGNINLHNHNITNNNIKIGYFIFKDYRNKGYASEALNEVIKYTFKTLKIHKIIANTSAENVASNNTLLKAGFILEGINHEQSRVGLEYRDSHNYYIINKENV